MEATIRPFDPLELLWPMRISDSKLPLASKLPTYGYTITSSTYAAGTFFNHIPCLYDSAICYDSTFCNDSAICYDSAFCYDATFCDDTPSDDTALHDDASFHDDTVSCNDASFHDGTVSCNDATHGNGTALRDATYTASTSVL